MNRAFQCGGELALSRDMLRTFSSLHFWFALKQGSQNSFVDIKGVAAKASQLFSACAFGHGETLRTRDEDGHLALECADCGQVKRVRLDAEIKGPRFHAKPVKGAPVATVRRIKQDRAYPRSASRSA